MLKGPENRGGAVGSHRRYILLVVFLVAVTVLYTWKKVEMASVAKRISSAEVRADSLVEERSKLTASIAFRKKPGNIKKIAEEQLGMVYPTGRMIDLILDAPEGRVVK
jgi:hypothetical protein